MNGATSWHQLRRLIVIVFFAALPLQHYAQSSLYLADLTVKDGQWFISNATEIARSSVIDAPLFLAGDSILLVALKDGNQNTLRHYSLASRRTMALATDVSPMRAMRLIPAQQGFSILIDKEAKTYLWKYDDQGKPLRALLPNASFQQYAWIDDNALVAINNKTLSLVTLRPFAQTEVTRNVGPIIQRDYQQPSIYFVHKLANDYWLIKKVEGQSGKIITVSETLTETDVFAVASTGEIIMFNEGAFYHKKIDGDWKRADTPKMFENLSVHHIAFNKSGNKMAVVVMPLTDSLREED